MTTTKADELAAELEADGFSPKAHYGAAAELRRLAALEVARDALQLDYARLLEKHNNLHANAARDRAERDALRAGTERWRSLYTRAINEANGLTNYVEDRPELRRAEKQLEAIQREARAIDAAMKGTT